MSKKDVKKREKEYKVDNFIEFNNVLVYSKRGIFYKDWPIFSTLYFPGNFGFSTFISIAQY